MIVLRRRAVPVVVAMISLGSVVASAACGTDPSVDEGLAGDGGTTTADGAVCGAGTGTPCPAGTACTRDEECEGACVASACTAGTLTDGKRTPSLGETDVDCGGPQAPKCALGRGCAADTDCTTAVCSDVHKTCVSAPSCKGASGPSGVETCGTAEPGAAGAKVESCCRALPLPERQNRLLDRYEITAGRLRAFVDALAATNGGTADVRAYAKAYAASHPSSQLGDIASGYDGLLDVLPGQGSSSPLPVHLGAFPLDPMNALDGCFMSAGGYGHTTYWQSPETLKALGVGYPDAQGKPDGTRKYPREVLDAKPVNCVMPLLLATFCAWDGGELARTRDYHEVWGRRPMALGNKTVFHPWKALLRVGEFNWRNGHGATCTLAWPGCTNPQPYHYSFPSAGFAPADDDTPAIAAPGRFFLDVTEITSASGEGWFDVGGNLMEAAWPVGDIVAGNVQDVCDVTSAAGAGQTACTRRSIPGVRRFAGALPHIALVGYSFEGHAQRSEAYLAAATENEDLLVTGDVKPVTFQYGKVGGRCARPAP